MPLRLRVGIIGLGRTWQRYQPVLRRLRELFDVRCVYDPRPHRSETAARSLGCSTAAGTTDLLDRPEVEALLLLDRQWFGLWPVPQACRLGKPAFCATSLVHDDAYADDLRAKVAATDTLVLMALPPTATQAMAAVRELLARRLGPARVVRCDWVAPAATATPAATDGLRSPTRQPSCACLRSARNSSLQHPSRWQPVRRTGLVLPRCFSTSTAAGWPR